MTHQTTMTTIIRNRISVRTYDSRPIPQDKLEILRTLCDDMNATALSGIRFSILSQTEQKENTKLGTYGIISGSHTYLVAVTKVTTGDALELGYLFEKFVLKATELELGTVWLGGTFNRSDFEKSVDLKADEAIAIVSPIGIAKNNRSLIDAAMRFGAGSKHRKPWETLFFKEDLNQPLTREEAGKYAEVLEMVRLGPSASNKQPWRIVKSGNDYHLYLERTPNYASMMNYDLQLNDIGIAQCHFELTCLDFGLKGHWEKADPRNAFGSWIYCLTWCVEAVSK
jgi:nitroreductase